MLTRVAWIYGRAAAVLAVVGAAAILVGAAFDDPPRILYVMGLALLAGAVLAVVAFYAVYFSIARTAGAAGVGIALFMAIGVFFTATVLGAGVGVPIVLASFVLFGILVRRVDGLRRFGTVLAVAPAVAGVPCLALVALVQRSGHEGWWVGPLFAAAVIAPWWLVPRER